MHAVIELGVPACSMARSRAATTSRPQNEKARLKQRSLTTKLIDHGEYPKRPSLEQRIMDKIHTPALVRALGLRNRPSMHAHVFATPHPHAYLQALQAIPEIDPLLVHRPPFPRQHDVDAQIAERRSRMGDLADPQA